MHPPIFPDSVQQTVSASQDGGQHCKREVTAGGAVPEIQASRNSRSL